MKKIIFTVYLIVFALTALSQSTSGGRINNQTVVAEKDTTSIQWSFLWGAFKSKNFQTGKEKNEKKQKIIREKMLENKKFTIDTSKYEVKRIFWGAIQWTEKKETNNKK